ncbi:sugar phosphate isomerase/epimerase family protein [Roseomonas sp. E05]|uniref:sugar phosphate isomerase/epimerase family protein n=1 Tax=Roseomonas sp. E05 TaxID=3046310 RepID=UPI0024B91300|nr:sugar phosphate isomerase/epimerase family protein [Roseomonas sp. E05]MDJ0390745.1 sugar phosphate isomerase/epimerase family protein [Roseomonas sp. E05]
MRDLAGRPDLCAINTATLGHSAPIGAVIEAVARQGFGGIAPWRRDLEGQDVAAVARQIRDAGLAVTGYCRSSAFPAATPEAARAAVEENCCALRDAATLGARCFVLVAGGLPPGSRDLAAARRQLRDGVGALLEEARQLGVTLALEPLHPVYAADRSCLCTLGEALDLCDALDPEARGGLGVAADVYHLWWDAALPRELQRAAQRRRIAAFHVCDWLVPTRDVLLDRGMMGDGVIDIPAIRAAVEAAGYGGLVEVEIFSAQDWWRRPMEETLAVCAERLGSVC